MASIHVLLLLSGVLHFCLSFLYRHHIFMKQGMTWPESQGYCRTNYTDLVTIQTKMQMKLIINMITGTDIPAAWIGLYRKNSTDLLHWSNGDQFMYSQWDLKHPGQETNMCTTISSVWPSVWQNMDCNKSLYLVCFQASQTFYFLVRLGKTWSAARDYCRAHQAELVSIRSDRENQKVKSIISTHTVWIGLYWDSSSGQWQWADGAFSSYQNWALEEPNNYGGNELCAYAYVNSPNISLGTWNDYECTDVQYFICYQDTIIELYLIKEKKTFMEAVFYCRMHYTDIVSIHSVDVQEQVVYVASNASGDGVWIGIRKHQVSGQWIWMNEDPVYYTNWDAQSAESTASDDCVVMRKDKNFTWRDSCCSSRYEFICYK
ncbi:macrophage mannose receptor 1-like [Protopterus annectens]|uniref:macrophage mannose receptor 1-like n=1 Tax=Protopterus annectens TaxID=7888 RepID=UPI001CF96E44|nr:macrophage mannose receptor 1-like [Protopterus annectens]